MNRKKLEAASNEGIITPEQVEALLSYFAEDDDPISSNNEEQLRFVRSFGDIFITLGIVFVTVAGAQINLSPLLKILPILLLVATSEWLIRHRRLALPGMALLMALVYFTGRLVGFEVSDEAVVSLALMTVVSYLFYIRYKMPFSLALVAIGLISLITILLDINTKAYQHVFAVYGCLVFVVAMWFDSRDRFRLNRLSDTAFWLHLLAAPLIVHGVMITLLLSDQSLLIKEVFMLGFFFTFFMLALYIDRRALLVSSLSYAIYAVIDLAGRNEIEFEDLTLSVFVGFGIFIVFFGVYWYSARDRIFANARNMWLSNYVPPFLAK
jgi:hypothetical protein